MNQETMRRIHSMLRLFGDRYLFCDRDQAEFDLKQNREEMVSAYVGIMDYVRLVRNETE